MSRFLNIHVLQQVPASCINRGEANEVKTVTFGGTLRGRVSSQSWKSAMRKWFKEKITIGIRTRRIKEIVKERILDSYPEIDEKDAEAVAIWSLYASGLKKVDSKKDKKGKAKDKAEGSDEVRSDEAQDNIQTATPDEDKAQNPSDPDPAAPEANDELKDEKNDVMFFLSPDQIDAFVQKVVELYKADPKCIKNRAKTVEELKNTLNELPSIDMVLFGRMAASSSDLNIEATCQVAHAFSTHAIVPEYDFFTSVDEYDGVVGAGHMGNTEFDSCVLYRHANINIDKTIAKIGAEDAADKIPLAAASFILSMPEGHKNSFANQTYPSLVYVTIHSDTRNICTAFDAPLDFREGYVKASIEAFRKEIDKQYNDYCEYGAPEHGHEWYIGEDFRGTKTNINGLIDSITAAIKEA